MNVRSLGLFLMAIFQMFWMHSEPQQDAKETKASTPLSGYGTESSSAQRTWEKKFQDAISRDSIRENMRHLSARPHHVGSPYDKDNAQWILAQVQGMRVSTPRSKLSMFFSHAQRARSWNWSSPHTSQPNFRNPPSPADPTSNQTAEQLPTYNAYSIDGDVTAPLVYVNYGHPRRLRQLGAPGHFRQGRDRHRALRRRLARHQTAKSPPSMAPSAASFIPIPRDDGYFRGDVFPQGALAPADGVQRGSVMDMPLYPGDPLTPGIGATADAKRLPIEERSDHHQNSRAADFLRRRAAAACGARRPGRAAKLARRTAHHLSPRAGPGESSPEGDSNWDIKPLYDVIAKIRGVDVSRRMGSSAATITTPG